MKYLYHILLFASIILFGCSKEKTQPQPPPPPKPVLPNYKMEIVKGANQTDSIGHTLKDSIIIRVTNNGQLLNKGYLRFTGSGCDVNATTEVAIYAGRGFFRWQLSGVVGSQQLKVVFLDSARVSRDSLTVTANAAMPLHGWQPSPCMVPYQGVKTLCKLTTGKLFALFFNSDFLFTSDDNGINWHKLPEIDGHYKIINIVTTPNDGLFMCTQGNGVLYSSDAGKTWVSRNNGIAYFTEADGIFATTLGKIIVRVSPDGKVYTTKDNGLNWSISHLGLFEQPNGNEYMLDNFNMIDNFSTLRMSSDGGTTWNYVRVFPVTTGVSLLFIDSKGYIYASEGTNYSNMQLYRSTDNGITFTPVYSATYVQGTPLGIAQMSEQNGIYYFYAYGSGLIKTTDFKTYTSISPAFTEQSRSYILNKNNQLIIGLYYGSIYYYLP